jgi:L-ascorbate metabolism protein UlaG (beta-lactamase superfamily)
MNRWYKAGEELLTEIRDSKNIPGGVWLWYLGQMGFAVKISGTICYFDAVLSPNPASGTERVYPPPFAPGQSQSMDYFFCTHDHIDHTDMNTVLPLAKSNPRVKFIVPNPNREALLDSGVAGSRVIGAREGEKIALENGLSASPVAAAHPEYEQDSRGDYCCLGYVLEGEGLRLYHAGDTLATVRLADTLKALGPLNIAILPINGADWERTAGNIIGNMTIIDAVKLCRAVGVDLAIPGHYDLFAGNSENPAAFTDCLYKLCPAMKHHIFALGERLCYIP